MKERFDFVIVSTHGRGHWLASELAARKYKTALVDVSHFLGPWSAEDIEGPFGFFHVDQMLPSQVSRLIEEDYNDLIPEGFVIWTEQGPIEFGSPIVKHHLQKNRWLGDIEKHIQNQSGSNEVDLARKQRLLDRPFSETWIAHFAHHFSCNVHLPNHLCISEAQPVSLFAPYNIRRVSTRGFEQSFQWLEKRGVDVLTKAFLQDLWIERRQVLGVEVKSAWSGVVRAKVIIWCLTSEETHFMNPQLSGDLYPYGSLEPQWSWIRYQLDLSKVEEFKVVPQKFVLLHKKNLPWTHENFMIVQKTTDASIADVWLKIPTQFRFQRSYLEGIGARAVDVFNQRFVTDKVAHKSYPIEHRVEASELGPSRFPVYSLEAHRKLRRTRYKNLIFDGPEEWPNMDWIGRFQRHHALVESFLEEKNKKLLEAPAELV